MAPLLLTLKCQAYWPANLWPAARPGLTYRDAELRGGRGSAKNPVPSSHHVSPRTRGTPTAGANISCHRTALHCCTLTHSTCGAGLHFHTCLHHIFYLQHLSCHCHLKDQTGFFVSPHGLSFVQGRGTGRILLSSEHQGWQQPRAGYLQAMLQKLTALNTHLLN